MSLASALRWLNFSFWPDRMADLPLIKGKTSLLTASSVLARSFALSKFRKSLMVKWDGDKEGLGCPNLSYLSVVLLGIGVLSSSEY